MLHRDVKVEELLDRDPALRPAGAATVQARLRTIVAEDQQPIEAPPSRHRTRAGLLARLGTVALAGVLTEDVPAAPVGDPPPRDRTPGGRDGGA